MIEVIKKNKISFVVVCICFVLISIISSFVIFHDILVIDEFVYNFLIDNFRCDFIDFVMINITKLGNTAFVIIFTTLMFCLMYFNIKNKRFSCMFLISIGGITFINQGLKFLVKRIRPDINRLIEIGGYSFPSGHAMVSTVLYGFLAYIAYKFIKVKWLRNSIMAINIMLILLICISRIYVGVHYFSDVMVGFLISIIFLVFVINFLELKTKSQN